MRSVLLIASVLCALGSAAFAGITISSPTAGATVGSPVHVVASASSSQPITAMMVYVDNVAMYNTASAKIDTYIPMSAGSHYVVVQSWDSTGYVQKQPMAITVGGGTPTGSAGITISSPTAGATIGSPVHVVAGATPSSSQPITAMMVYVDNVAMYNTASATVDTNIPMSAGNHYLVVQSWDATGYLQKQQMTITVGSSDGSSPTIPPNATYYSNIDQMTGWESCDNCAGPGGNGPSAPYSMAINQSSPSLDGRSAVFSLGGKTPYSAALWWKQLGGNGAVRNLVYDLYFYVKNPSAPQALEFDVNQTVNGKKFIFGTQCDYKDHKDWDVWDTANSVWIKTGIPCVPPLAYTWNHLVLEFQRTTGEMARFVAVTLNGKKSYINRSFYPRGANAYELNAAFQLDGDGSMTNYSVWIDKMQLIAW